MVELGKPVRLFEKIWGFGSFMNVYARTNGRGRFLEIKLPSYDVTCVDVYLKVPEEENSSGWRSFAKLLSDFAKEGVRSGGMEMMDSHCRWEQ